MAELADAHGSGPCESNFMQVQVLLPAPRQSKLYIACSDFLFNRKLRDFLLNKNTDFIPVQYFRLCRNAHGKTKRYCLDRRLRRAAKPLCSAKKSSTIGDTALKCRHLNHSVQNLILPFSNRQSRNSPFLMW